MSGLRDIAITLIIFGSLPFIFKRAQIGVMMWVWISVMNPHRLAYGFAHDFSFAVIIAGATLLSVALSKDMKAPPLNSVTVAFFMFVAWTGVSTIFAIYPDLSFFKWVDFMKTQLMAILIPMLFHKKEDLQRLIWVIVLSLAFYGTKGGLFTLLTGGSHIVWGPESSAVQENNALAVALIMMIPLMRYLHLTTAHAKVRWGLLGMMALCSVAVLGSQSRGALLAASAMLIFLWWKGRNKLAGLVLAVLFIPLLLAFMPETWYRRMDTMNTYEADASASSRLNAWTTMINLANDRPLTGGGFVVSTMEVYQRYSPKLVQGALAAHSIYFQALGEHGYVGLGLYLLLFYTVWRKARWIMRAVRKRADLAWAADLSAMMQVTLVGFAVGGAFLSLVTFDVPYYLVAIMVATLALVKRELKAPTPTPAPAAATAPEPSARFGRKHSPRPGSG